MSKEILQSKIKKWISSVRTIQGQANKRFEDKEKEAFVGCIVSLLSGSGNVKLISDDNLDTLEKYIKNSPSDDFKAALENFYVLLKKNNTSTGLKEFYEVVDDQNFTETLQKICDSYEYEKQQSSAAGKADFKIKQWINNVKKIQEQANIKFDDKDKRAYVNCIKAVLSGRNNPKPISDNDLKVLSDYINSATHDGFKTALNDFYTLIKNRNTPEKLKEFYESVDDQNFAETLQKICDSYEYEKQQSSAAGNNQTSSSPKTPPTLSEDARKWYDCFLDIQENIHMFGIDEVKCFTYALDAVNFGGPIKNVQPLLRYCRHLAAGTAEKKDLDFLDSVLDFCGISQRRLSDIGSIHEFRACFNKDELDGIFYFVNENVKIIKDKKQGSTKTFRVTDGWIKIDDCDGNSVTRPSKIYTNTRYVYYHLKYEAPASMTEVEIKTRLIGPDGSLKGGSDYTMQRPYKLDSADHILHLSGWGNDYGSIYDMPGEWTAEFYVNDVKVYTLKFKVEQAPAPTEPTIRVDNVRFDNCDKDLNIITQGSLPLNTKYVTPVIKYTRLRNYGTISLSYRIIQPDGQVKRSASSPIGVTTKTSFVPNESGERVIPGWGSDLGTAYSSGKYRFELLQGNRVIYTTYFYIDGPKPDPKPDPKPEPKPEPKPTPKPSATSTSTSHISSQNEEMKYKKGCGCFPKILLVILIALGYWYWGDIRNWIFGDDKPKHDYVQVLPGIWNGTMGETDVTLEIDSIQNDSVVNAVISGQFKKVQTQKLKGYIGTNDSVYLDGANKGKYFNGKFRIGMSDDGRETMHALFFDKSSGDTIRLDAHKDEIPRVRQAKSTKSTKKKSKKKPVSQPKVEEQKPAEAIQEVVGEPAPLKESDIVVDETTTIQQ